MRQFKFKAFCLKTLAIILIAGQFTVIAHFTLAPKKAEAFWGIGDFTFNTEVANWYDVFKDIGLGVAQRIAISYANKYLTRFADKLIDKYRIKNYLIYERVLSGYYLNQYIYENVDDPDLRAIYNILATDISTRAQVGPEGVDCKITPASCKPFLAALKEKLDKYYYDRGGIDSNLIFNPPANMSNVDYFAAAQAYWLNPPNFTQQNLYGQFGQMVADSQRAAGQEIAAGNGLKSDRSNPTGSPVPYKCLNILLPGPYQPNQNPRANEANCVAAGGTWKIDATGLAQTVIQNPSAFVHSFATSSIHQVFVNNLGLTDNLYTTIGSLLGNFIFKKLNLDRNRTSGSGFDGTFNETGSAYTEFAGNVPMVKNIDVDGDNIPDGQDVDGDEKLDTPGVDTCLHGGVAPNCKKSTTAVTSPYFTPICRSIDRAVTALTEFSTFIDTYADQLKGGASLKGKIIWVILAGPVGAIFGGIFGGSVDNFKNKADADIWGRRAGEVNSAMDDIINTIQSYHSTYFDRTEFAVGRYSVFIGDIAQSLMKDKDLDLARFGSGGGGLKNLMKYTGYILRYLIEVKAKIGKCENPNLKAVSDIPPPPELIDPGNDDGGGFVECDNPPDTISPDPRPVMDQVRSEEPWSGLDLTDESQGGGRDQFTGEVARRLNANDSTWGRKKSSAGAPISTDTLGYLRPDVGEGRFEAIDIIVGGTGALQRGCFGVVDSGQVWVAP